VALLAYPVLVTGHSDQAVISFGEKRTDLRRFLVMCVTVRRFEFTKILDVYLFSQKKSKKVLRIYTDRHSI
jgi:hypothetical protein